MVDELSRKKLRAEQLLAELADTVGKLDTQKMDYEKYREALEMISRIREEVSGWRADPDGG